MPESREAFSNGNAATRNPRDLLPGELQQSTGGYYKEGDPVRLHKLNGRSAFGDTGSAAKVSGLALLQFDSGGTDRLVALSGSTLYSSTPGTTGTFGSSGDFPVSLTSTPTGLSAAHQNDRWYLADGANAVLCTENDGTTYDAGMKAPVLAPIVAGFAATGTEKTFAGNSGGFTNPTFAYDSDYDTYASGTLSAAGTITHTWTPLATATDVQGQTFALYWSLAGSQIGGDSGGGTSDTAGIQEAHFNVTVKLEITEDADAATPTWTTIKEATYTYFTPPSAIGADISSGTVLDQDKIGFRATLTYNSGINQATLRIYDARVYDAPSGTFTSTGIIKYAYTEYDEVRGQESNPSEVVELAAGTYSYVTVAMAGAARNTRTTHYRIYKTAENGSTMQLGQTAEVKVASKFEWLDDFKKYDYQTQPRPLMDFLIVQTDQESAGLPVEKNDPPPVLKRIRSYKGSLVGIKADNQRALVYCILGRAWSWPKIYIINSFPMEEHDTLVDCLELGDTLLIAGQDVMMRIDRLPRISYGSFDASEVQKIQGAPGLACQYGLTNMTISGEPLAAWVSPHGLYMTNGQTYTHISQDFDWDAIESFDKSGWALHWDARRKFLVFAYSSADGGENDRYAIFHMLPEHRKESNLPKWTGPHYGEFAAMAGGQVSNRYRLYSAHADDGKVYLEGNGSTDAANSYDSSGTNPFIVQSREIHADGDEFSVLDCRLHHGDFGSGQTATVAWSSVRDLSSTQTRLQTVALSSSKTQFDIARSGEAHSATITHTGTGVSWLRNLTMNLRQLGRAGEIRIA